MRRVIFVIFGLGILCSYVLYAPVPAEFPDPWKYRAMAAITRTMYGLNYIKMWIRDFKRPPQAAVFKDLMDVMPVPVPPEEVPGSNIRSRLTTLDGVKVRLYEPIVATNTGPSPAFVYFHGGGMVFMNIDSYEAAFRLIAERLNIITVAVEYRLAPEHPFPAGFDDSLAATKWLLTHADELGVDPHRVAVGGESAGGYLTAAVSGAIADDPSVPNIKLQVLLQPYVQNLDFNTPSYQKMKQTDFGSVMLTAEMMAEFASAHIFGHMKADIVNQLLENNHTSVKFKHSAQYQKYLNHDVIHAEIRKDDFYESPKLDHGNEELWKSMEEIVTSVAFSPLLREDMSNLPRAYIATGGCDIVRDDGIFYAHRLREAGVPVEWVHYEYAYHGIPWFGPTTMEIGRRLADEFLNYTKKHL